MAAEPFLSESSLLDKSGNALENGLTAADLATYRASTNYLRLTNNMLPTSGNDFETGRSRRAPFPAGGSRRHPAGRFRHVSSKCDATVVGARDRSDHC
jgi:hypothetical protein